MNNEKMNQIIDEVYENFINTYKSKNGEIILPPFDYIDDNGVIMSKEQFITNIKYDYWFSEKWGLKIAERELSYDERFRIAYQNLDLRKKLETESKMLHFPHGHNRVMDDANIPTKLITITYNNEKTEIYE